MAESINKVMILGNLGADPEVRLMQDGTKVVTFSVATSETWLDKAGEKKEKVEWHRVVILNERFSDTAEKYLKKGSKVYVEGQIHTRKWTDKAGVDRYTSEIIVPRFKGDFKLMGKDVDSHSANAQTTPNPSSKYTASSKQSKERKPFDLDDEIPF